VYIDTKHSQVGAPDGTLSYSDDIKVLIKKRRHLAEQFPDAEHIMVITSNKPAQQADGRPHTAATLLHIDCIPDPRTCLIILTGDSLAWALAPTFAHFLVGLPRVRPAFCFDLVEISQNWKQEVLATT
jgi:hypothetical protein